ncbi:RHS repeat-associated core domain-containing protein, partial [Saccharopolyspora sp. NPDC002578]
LGPGDRILEQIDFTWDGVVLAEQAHTDGVPGGLQFADLHVTVWDYEPGTFRPLAQRERAPLRHAPQQWVDQQFYSIVTDLVGSPSELINDQGGVAWFHRTTLWGNTLDHSRTGAYTPLRFPGQYADPETGLNYNFHRHYDPATGRYGSGDPLGLDGDVAVHSYVHNPTEWIDPLGLAPEGCRRHWEITPEGTERTARHRTFGTFSQSKSDGLWWSKDNAGHGESAWKVFEEGKKGLTWRADADEYGDFIEGKHKGPTGLFVPWKELGLK